MRLNGVTYSEGQPVEGYGPGFFRIGGQVWTGPVLTSAVGTQSWGGLDDAAPLEALDVDVLFVGMGADIAHLPETLRTQLETAGLGVEVMSSPAAARTYNVLLGEGRRVALALLPV
ncbi:MAG: Mth938-like domain-containing protein [Pseudomonadota bacterium]